LEEADALADRVVLIHGGRTHAEGTAEEIKSRTGQRAVRCVTALAMAQLAALDGVAQVEPHGAGVQIVTSNPDQVLAQLFSLDPTLRGIEVTALGLEDAFLEMTA
jgi:ABC-2 type transport system ATP-binding protein